MLRKFSSLDCSRSELEYVSSVQSEEYLSNGLFKAHVYVWCFPWCSLLGTSLFLPLSVHLELLPVQNWSYLGIAWLFAGALCSLGFAWAAEPFDLYGTGHTFHSSVKLQNFNFNLALLCCQSCARDPCEGSLLSAPLCSQGTAQFHPGRKDAF